MKKVIASLLIVALVAIGIHAAQLTSATPRTYEVSSYQNAMPVAASTSIYKGSAVGTTNIATGAGSGYARQLLASDTFKGFAEETKLNASGAAGDKTVTVRHTGIILLSVANVGITNEGMPVWARDGATFVLDPEATNSRIGTVHRYVSAGVAMVKFNADNASDLTGTTNLTDSGGGNATGNTITNIVAAGAGTNTAPLVATQNAISVLALKINEILQKLK